MCSPILPIPEGKIQFPRRNPCSELLPYVLVSEPILWIHVAGLAVVPIFLELCLLGLAVSDPLLPAWLELFIVAAVGVVRCFGCS